MSSFIALGTLFLTCLQTAYAQCQSYGLDYQDGESYQMVRSPDNFAGTQEFEGCENDQAHNVIVDPQGNEYECSMTPMQPEDTAQQYVCDSWTYDTMYTGDWSIVIISNNGNGDPVNFQRDMYLDFGDGSDPASNTTSTSSDAPSETTSGLAARSLAVISSEAAVAARAPAEGAQTFTNTMFGPDLPTLPTTLLHVIKRNESAAMSSPHSPKKAELVTTVDVTSTSHVTRFTTVESMHTAVRVPVKSMHHHGGWNGTGTTSSTWTSSLMTTAPSTTKTVKVLKATPSTSRSLLAMPTVDSTPAEDHTQSSKSDGSGGYSYKFRMALLHGDKPDEETRRKFVEERHRVLHGSKK